jgi:hypothetical protein
LSSGFSYLNKKKYTNLQNIYFYTKFSSNEKNLSTNLEKFCLNLPNFLVFKNIENFSNLKIMDFSAINLLIFKASSNIKVGSEKSVALQPGFREPVAKQPGQCLAAAKQPGFSESAAKQPGFSELTLKQPEIQFLNSLSNFYTFSNKFKKSTIKHTRINNLLKQFILFSKLKKIPYSIRNNSSLVLLNSGIIKNDLKYIKNLESNLANFFKTDMSLIPFFTNFEWQDAGYFADEIVYLLERRVSFRQLKNKILKQLTYNPYIQGVRITCSGRVGGKSKKAQRAKVDSLKYGETSLHVFSSKIDFAHRTAHTPLGSSGIKVWICYK